MKEFEDLLTQVGLIGTALIFVLLLVRGWWLWRRWEHREGPWNAPANTQVMGAFASLGLVILGVGLMYWLFVLQRGSLFMPQGLKISLAGVLVAFLMCGVVSHLRPHLPVSRWAMARKSLGGFATWMVGGLLIAAFHSANQHPQASSVVLLDLPFHGEWVATGAGPTARTNHHHRIASQRHAVDLARACPDGRLFLGEGIALEESCTFGAAVLAPVDGVVVHAVDGLSDHESRQELAGNHVIIRMAEERYVVLAHLQQGSVLVSPMDSVQSGQVIGRAGNSGNSDFPHLHLHVQDGPVYDLQESTSIPFRFREADVRRYLFWRKARNFAVLANDRLRESRRIQENPGKAFNGTESRTGIE